MSWKQPEAEKTIFGPLLHDQLHHQNIDGSNRLGLHVIDSHFPKLSAIPISIP